MLRPLCSRLSSGFCRFVGMVGAPPAAASSSSSATAAAPAAPAAVAFSSTSLIRGLCSGAGFKAPPAHWDRSGGGDAGSDNAASALATASELPPPEGVALATHMLLNQPVYNVLGDVVPVNEYHLTEQMQGGIQYHALPIVFLGARRNNTIVTLTDSQHRVLATTSCGVEGFANAKKSTTVAAQVVGVSIALKARKLGIHQARVMIRGMNPLRLACLKGMSSAGLQIVSITDNTKIHYGKGRRPRKPPRK